MWRELLYGQKGQEQPMASQLAPLPSWPLGNRATSVDKALRNVSWPEQGPTMLLGLYRAVDGTPFIAMPTQEHAQVAAACNSLLAEALQLHDLHFIWTTLEVRFNMAETWHQQKSAIGPSAILGLGDLPDGFFTLEGHGPTDVNRKLVIFDGNKRHKSGTFAGTGFSIIAFRHIVSLQVKADIKGRLKALGFIINDPYCILPPSRGSLADQGAYVMNNADALYIGRGSKAMGLAPSKWQNPFTITMGRSRHQAIQMFRTSLASNNGLLECLGELEGRKHVCHCRLSQRCHADILQECFDNFQKRCIEELKSSPDSEHQALAEADRRRELAHTSANKKHPAPLHPSMVMGSGAPLMVGSGSKHRLFCDGGGLCSPGLWEPGARKQPHTALLLQRAIREELRNWEASCPGVKRATVAKLCTGNVTSNPFLESATRKLQLAVH